MSSSNDDSAQGAANTTVSPPVEFSAGTVVNGIYRMVRLLGMGGMGEVWEARHERTKGRVALKLLLPDMGRYGDVLQRFQREVEITSGLNHPNIVRVSDADKLPDGRPYLVMEFLEGHDLTASIGRPMPLTEVTEIIEQTAMGLQAAHGKSIIHRDLKPANIFIVPLPGTSRPLVKILDFGISRAMDGLSRLTQTREVVGTPQYMAPEQAKGGMSAMDARADQFSLAAIAYELLTGRMAFDGDGVVNVIYKVVNEEPSPFSALGISSAPGVELVVRRGLSKRADDRFTSVLEFSAALKRAAGGAVVDARPSAATAERLTRLLPTSPPTTLRESAAQIESMRSPGASDGRTGRVPGLRIGVGAAAVAAGVIAILALRPASSVKEAPASAQPPPIVVRQQPPAVISNPPTAAMAPANLPKQPVEAPKPPAAAAEPPVKTPKPPVASAKPTGEGTSRHRSRSKTSGAASKPTRQPGPINDDL